MRRILKLVPNGDLEEFQKSMELHLSELVYGSVTTNHGKFVTQFKFIVGDDQEEELEDFYNDYIIGYFRQGGEKDSSTVSVRFDSIGTLLDIIDYVVTPYLESDEYDKDHWSRELDQARQEFLKVNELEITYSKSH